MIIIYPLKFFELLEGFGECSGLKINHDKSEIILLEDCAHSSLNHNFFKSIKIKTYVKILGIHFTYDYRIKQKVNFDKCGGEETSLLLAEFKLSRHSLFQYSYIEQASDLFRQRIRERGRQ